jgi:hypothetical protein
MDPFWILPEVNIDAEVYRVLEIRYRIDSSDSIMQIMWATTIDPEGHVPNSIGFDIVPDNDWHIKTAELDQESLAWYWTVTFLRLDPVHFGSSGDEVEIDYIRICAPTP